MNKLEFSAARDLLLRAATPVGTERVALEDCAGRILARDLTAVGDVPPFDRAAYDGYALRACDVQTASERTPVTLKIIEEVAAGSLPTRPVTAGTAVKILTGAPIPENADAVIAYERTRFDGREVTLFAPLASGANIVRKGEDVRRGQSLARRGDDIDAALLGTLAAQGAAQPEVFRIPRVGLLCTGSEVIEADAPMTAGKIRNTARYLLTAALQKAGCAVEYLGCAGDCAKEIAALLTEGLARCDLLVTTGGVSAGDYDLTPEAMVRAGAEPLFRGVAIKPGMACAYGVKDGKLLCGLSGNPVAAMLNFSAVALPAIRRLCGRRDCLPQEIELTLASDFEKSGRGTRLLYGSLDLSDGTVRLRFPPRQGGAALGGAVGCDAVAIVPAGSPPLRAGSKLKGFRL